MKKILLLLTVLLTSLSTWAQSAATYADGVYKIYWDWNDRGYLTYHDSEYPNEPQLAGVDYPGCQDKHYAITAEGISLSWYLYTSSATGKSYLFEATTGKFITFDPNVGAGDNGKACSLSTEPTEFSQLDLYATTNTDAYKFRFTYNDIVYRFCSGCGSEKNQHPVRFAKDGQTDGGVPFVFVSEGASIEESVKDAAIAKIKALEEAILPEGVGVSAFGTNAVTDGTNFYATLQAAVEAVAGQANSTLYCKPGADVGSLQHAPVTATLTVYGNGAYVSGGSERDFDLGNSDPSGGKDITADMALTVKNLDGCGAWGTKATEHTVNVVFENCKNMFKVFITGTTGTLNISMTDCAFEGAFIEALYSNADGNITLTNVAFSNLNKAVNLNHKATGTQTVRINGCSFTNCGANVAKDEIPVRVLSSVDGGKSVLSVSDCTFSGTPEGGADILLDYGKGVTEAAVASTSANVVVEKEENVGTTTTVASDNSYEFTTAMPVAKIGETTYATLAEAVAAAQNGETITLIDNVVLAEIVTIPADKTLTIDLNGKSISMEESIIATAYAINNLGNLTITDGVGGGSINARGIYNGYGNGGANVATAKITVVNGTINAKGTNGGGAAIFNYGVADIQGGTFTSVASYAIALQTGSTMTIGENAIITGGINSWQSTLTITGGTISNDKSGKHVVYAGESAVTINGGTFHNNNSGNATIMASGSTAAVEITGGTFTLNIVDASSSYLIDATSSATYTISGGSFTGGIRAQGGTKYEITGGTFTNEYGNYNVYEGGDINISGGTFTGSYAQKFATDNLAAGYELNADGTVVAKPVAEVNGVKYATFAEAISAAHKATDKVTITLKKDITVSAAISINKLVTIDLNGKAISSAEEGYVFEVTGGELVLQGEGSIGAICYIINDADYKAADKTFALTENKNNVDIVYNRTFGHTNWQVLYVPFAIPVVNMEGFEVYSISDVTNSGVVIEQVVEGGLSANTPYIIKATEAGDKTIKVTGATLSVPPVAYEKTIGNFTINGTYSSMEIDAKSQYVLTNGLWCQLSDEAVENGNNILGAFRVYLTANGENTPSVVRFVINNSDATAIDELKAENGNVKAEVYDLSGRRVEKAVKGIYVVNGVKVIK